MGTLFVVLILIAAVAWAVRSLWKTKKSGAACASCPNGGACHGCAGKKA